MNVLESMKKKIKLKRKHIKMIKEFIAKIKKIKKEIE